MDITAYFVGSFGSISIMVWGTLYKIDSSQDIIFLLQGLGFYLSVQCIHLIVHNLLMSSVITLSASSVITASMMMRVLE